MVVYNSWNPLQSHTLLCSLFMITVISFLVIPHAIALSFNLTNIGPQHHNVNITTYPDAYISSQGIQVTSDEHSSNLHRRASKARYINPLHLWNNASGNLADFNTHFSFLIDLGGSPNYADGLAFFLAPDGSNISVGGAIGLPINPKTLKPTSPFVAVEFDTRITFSGLQLGKQFMCLILKHHCPISQQHCLR